MFDYKSRYDLWLSKTSANAEVLEGLNAIKNDDTAKREYFTYPLSFGTGGLRGIMGVGDGQMNVYTVAQATQGVANHMNSIKKGSSVAIAYDSRLKSDEFAFATASVLAANGIKVYIYKELMPTPALSYAVRALKTDAGVVITASHNPAAYNGYKIYNESGAQITLDAANAIASEITKVDIFDDVKTMSFEDGLASGAIEYISDEITEKFITTACEGKDEDVSDLNLVYTPLCGSGKYCVLTALDKIGVKDVKMVKEQEMADGNFPTCEYPNPEAAAAMELGEKMLSETGADILMATDPDCDRVGCSVKTKDGIVRLNGNEIGLILLQYILETHKNDGTMPKDALLIKTIVTTPMADKMAEAHGVETYNVLTGFKFIGEQINWLEEDGQQGRYLFGFEESCGYLPNVYVRDKDGVSACVYIARAASYYKKQGLNFIDVLQNLYKTYGVYKSLLLNYDFPGLSGMESIKSCMSAFRQNPIEGAELLDYLNSDHMVGKNPLPKSDVLLFKLDNGTQFIVRPSGTEPKLKIYLFAEGQTEQLAENLILNTKTKLDVLVEKSK